ncbi:MAG: hypothetical protein M1319_02325 [Chloroflexi bacterium]|nr:hypothetical protein [Chloroflexota bacterium]
MKRLLDHAFTNVPFYRRRLQEAGVHPDDIVSLGDLARIPVLTREEVVKNRQSMVAVNFPRNEVLESATGGSTGVPMGFYYSKNRLDWSWAAHSRLNAWFGVEKGTKVAVISGGDFILQPTTMQKARSWLRRERWLSSYDMGKENMQAFAEYVMRFRPEVIRGCNSALWLFAYYLRENGLALNRPRVIFGGLDKLHDFQRDLIEQTFGCPVAESYSARETGQIAGQCSAGSLHIWAELHRLEVVNNGQPVEPGEMGEVVITALEEYAMPLIRYANGDVARMDGNTCSCGRGLPVLSELVGRKCDFFSMPSGMVISGHYFVHLLKGWPGVRKYQVRQPSTDQVDILYEADGSPDQAWIEGRRREIQAHLGPEVMLRFQQVDQIPPTPAGKHLFVISEVPVDLRADVPC